ncbi:hypothetical protein IE81DRAFT_220363 [Ceraceosorus guamensis]|uniref:Uncharacterized protein n=1 Tax=Ceraceosorus guamensis TaxID=1522189 RepID=A0A316VTD3_9BASI|nr:hypothetical protein IE81DRAFT_220363 [Ceraceosorus guamensis]PWN40484.1 hypothetical protein IE81DRAFT_220363 [Ceraceosorus guamensis]
MDVNITERRGETSRKQSKAKQSAVQVQGQYSRAIGLCPWPIFVPTSFVILPEERLCLSIDLGAGSRPECPSCGKIRGASILSWAVFFPADIADGQSVDGISILQRGLPRLDGFFAHAHTRSLNEEAFGRDRDDQEQYRAQTRASHDEKLTFKRF